jgi:hypothetical protein
VTRASLREYGAVQRERYRRAPRAEKHELLNEVVAVTGLHRKAAIRLLRRPLGPPTSRPRAGRPRRLSFAKTPSGGQVVDRSALIMPRSNRRSVRRLNPRFSSGPVVVAQEPAQSLTTPDPGTTRGIDLGHDQGVAEPLMVSLFVVVRHELVDGAEQSPLPK